MTDRPLYKLLVNVQNNDQGGTLHYSIPGLWKWRGIGSFGAGLVDGPRLYSDGAVHVKYDML